MLNFKSVAMCMTYLKSIILVFTVFISGCVATTGGLQIRGNGLPDNYADIATEMVGIAKQMCIKITGNSDKARDDWNKGRKMDVNDWFVRRFYTSNTTWVKAESISQGVIDDLYFETSTKKLVCGSHAWGKYEDAAHIKFTEYGAKPTMNSLTSLNPSVTTVAIPSSTTDSINRVTATLGSMEKRVLAVRWEGYPNLMVGEAVIQQNKTLATLKVQLPNNEGTCTGVSQLTNSSNGIWTVSCTNNLAATGTFLANGLGTGSSGSGKDKNGRIVEFTIGVSN
jgi:hypothetical protein